MRRRRPIALLLLAALLPIALLPVAAAAPGAAQSGPPGSGGPGDGCPLVVAEAPGARGMIPGALDGAWLGISPSPIPGRLDASATWSGTEVLIWGGRELRATDLVESFPVDGAAWDPATDTWRPIPAAPIKGRLDPITAWTGAELLVWGGRGRRDGAAWDPSTGRWRQIARPAERPAPGARSAVWTGDELIAWAAPAAGSDDAGAEGLGYDPATDRWRVLPPSGLRGRRGLPLAWTGQEVVALSLERGRVTGAAYDPESDSWRPIAPVAILPGARPAVVSTGSEVVVLSALGPGQAAPTDVAWDPATGCWRALPPLLRVPEDNGAVVTGGGLVWLPGAAGTAWDPATGTWLDLPPEPQAAREYGLAAWAGDRLLVWGGEVDHPGTPSVPRDEGLVLVPGVR